jgi:hypothetical protein
VKNIAFLEFLFLFLTCERTLLKHAEKKPPRTEPPSTTFGYQMYEEIDMKEYWGPDDALGNEVPGGVAENMGQGSPGQYN